MAKQTPELQAVLHRLEKLERQNRRLKQLGLAVIVLLGSLALMGQTSSTNRIVEASAFVLKDANGKAGAMLGLSKDGPFLRMWGPGGKEQVLLGLSESGPSLALSDANGKRRIALADMKEPPGPFLWFSDENEKTRIAVDGDAARLTLYGSNGKEQIDLQTNDSSGPGLEVDDGGQERGAWLGVLMGIPTLSLVDLGAKAALGARVGADGTSLTLYDGQGFKTSIGSTDLVTPSTGETHKTSAASLVLFGKDSKVLWSAP